LALVALVVLARRPPLVAVAQVREARPGEDLTELTAAGYVAAERRSTVAPKIPGRLVSVLVKEGQQVTEGDILARLEDSDAVAALGQAQAQGLSANGQLGVARAARIKADRDLDRTARLAATGALSPNALDDARSQADSARENERAAVAQLRASADATAAARIRLDDTVIRAPFTGTISKKLADEGAVLAPAAVSDVNVGGIVEMVDLGSLDVEAELSEDRLASVREGQPALIFLDAYPEKVFQGVTGTVRPTIDKAKATAVVKVSFLQPPSGVFPNMGAKVSFLKRPVDAASLENEARLRVPRSALVNIGGRDTVFVVEGGRVRSETVSVVGDVGNEVMLRQGPPPGTQIVAAPVSRVRDGSKVRVATGST